VSCYCQENELLVVSFHFMVPKQRLPSCGIERNWERVIDDVHESERDFHLHKPQCPLQASELQCDCPQYLAVNACYNTIIMEPVQLSLPLCDIEQ
jgi:hypothetical protein